MALIRLQHRASSLQSYVIPVEHGGGEAHALGRVTRDPKSGTAGVRVVRATLPTTITLCARGTDGDTSEPLDEAVQRAPQIAAAIQAKQIVVLPVPVAAAPAHAVEQDAPAPPPVLASKPIPTPTPKSRTATRPEQE